MLDDCRPRSEPRNKQDFRPSAIPLTPCSAALFEREIRPSKKQVSALQRLRMYSRDRQLMIRLK